MIRPRSLLGLVHHANQRAALLPSQQHACARGWQQALARDFGNGGNFGRILGSVSRGRSFASPSLAGMATSVEMVKFARADGTEVPAYSSAKGPKNGLVVIQVCSG